MTFLFILIGILLFGILIAIHELGHFIAAKLSGVQVNEFSINMGPALWKKKAGETTYAIRAIPIGGYCAMEGEDEDSDNPRAFTRAKWWKRLIILVAGAAMNFVFGMLLIMCLLSWLLPGDTMIVPRVDSFISGTDLNREGGLQVGDVLYRIDGERVYTIDDVSMLLSRNKSGAYDLEVLRDKDKVKLNDFAMERQSFNVDGTTKMLYGFNFTEVEKTAGRALSYGWSMGLNFARLVRLGLQDLFSGAVGVSEMSGPVGIVSVISEAGTEAGSFGAGLHTVLYLGAFIAINLAVMNLLPIPALDGGRVFFLLVTTAIEAITKKKINPKYEGYIHAAGMVILLAFMAFVTFQDIFKLFSR